MQAPKRASRTGSTSISGRSSSSSPQSQGPGLARVPIGTLRDRPLGRRLLQRAVQEVVDVARARGIPLADDETAQVVGAIDALPPGTKPSFLLDLESGGPTELDVLSGAVSRYAGEAGVLAPIHDTVTAALSST